MKLAEHDSIGKFIKTLLTLIVAGLLFYPLVVPFGSHSDWPASVQKFPPKGAQAFAEHAVYLLRARQFDNLARETDPRILDQAPDQKFATPANAFPSEEPKSVKLVGAHDIIGPDETVYELQLEYEFTHGWLIAETFIRKPADKYLLQGLNIQTLKEAVEQTNRFTFDGKGTVNRVFFWLAVAVLLIDLFAFALCMRRPGIGKWFWAVFILIGFFQIGFNWTTAEFLPLSVRNGTALSYTFLYIGFPVAQFAQDPYGPLILNFSLPLGAIMFLSRYLLRKPDTSVSFQPQP